MSSNSTKPPPPEHQNDVVADHSSYALNGKIMLCSVIIFLAASLAAFCFFTRRRTLRRQRSLHGGAGDIVAGIEPSALKNLPTFKYSSSSSSAAEAHVLKCAVCLSEFRNDEAGRVLPKCEHAFHVRCIDTWLESRSSCPVCRAPVRCGGPVQVVVVCEPVGKEGEPVVGL